MADQITVLSNMELKNSYPGTHATSNAGFLSAAKAKWTESTDYHLGTTVDQIAAKQIGQETQLAVARAGDGPAPDRGPMRQRVCLRLPEQSCHGRRRRRRCLPKLTLGSFSNVFFGEGGTT